uniref:WD40/YVTN/BNR-like repeat-containing protein n=1 Tax=Fulvivirga sp. TaxID=1931237 RepID=UPI00404ADDD0
AIAGVTSQKNVFYMGATGGGLWKTTNYGNSWDNISDGFFASSSIGAIGVFQNDPNIIYVGTGSDGLRSNVIAGKGIYKSKDAGKTWSSMGLELTGHIGAVRIDPSNPDIVYVAAIGNAFKNNEDRGIFKTTDGGTTWDKILYHSDSIGFVDIEISTNDPNTLYAAAWRAERKPWTIISGSTEGGIYKSTDAGKTWQKLSKGLPQSLIGKIDIAVTPADPNNVYAIIEAPDSQGGVIYKHRQRCDLESDQ